MKELSRFGVTWELQHPAISGHPKYAVVDFPKRRFQYRSLIRGLGEVKFDSTWRAQLRIHESINPNLSVIRRY